MRIRCRQKEGTKPEMDLYRFSAKEMMRSRELDAKRKLRRDWWGFFCEMEMYLEKRLRCLKYGDSCLCYK